MTTATAERSCCHTVGSLQVFAQMAEAVRDLYKHDRYFPIRGKMKVLGKAPEEYVASNEEVTSTLTISVDLAEETAVYETRAGYTKTWRFYISCKNSQDSCVNQNIEKTIIRFVVAAEGVWKYGFPEGGFGFFWIASIASEYHPS